MAPSHHLPPGTPPGADESDTPDFRDWMSDPANEPEADALISRFVLDEGLEMVGDLVASRGQQHQWTAERWIDKLRHEFERWWEQGRPRVTSDKIRVTYITALAEREAHVFLDQHLPPQVVYVVAQRRRRAPGGGSEPLTWFCRIEDGQASSGGRGISPLAAAREALAAWREFVTGSRVEIVESTSDRPPLLDAPSSGSEPDAQSDKRAV
jgi:hypothetical protein